MSDLHRTASDPAALAAQSPTENARFVRAVHDQGLAFDLGVLSRRRLLRLGGGGALALMAGFAGPRATAAECVDGIVPEETAGPYPADGSNGPDIRVEEGVVRSDITTSFGSSTTTAEGVPATISLTLQGVDNCLPMVGAAVYLWHCDRDGNYSIYSQGVTGENYLRGIQESDETGTVTFTSIFPACYAGRWPHIHFEVYASLEEATSGTGSPLVTSQIAIPEEDCEAVFATAGYEQSVRNLTGVSLATDNVFSDDEGEAQLATVTGDVESGYAIALTIGVPGEGNGEAAAATSTGAAASTSSTADGDAATASETSSSETSGSEAASTSSATRAATATGETDDDGWGTTEIVAAVGVAAAAVVGGGYAVSRNGSRAS